MLALVLQDLFTEHIAYPLRNLGGARECQDADKRAASRDGFGGFIRADTIAAGTGKHLVVTTKAQELLAAEGLRADRLPRHIAVIMDGNGRWAQQRGLPRVEGHRRGVASVRAIVENCAELGVEQLTLYCLSSENWKRPKRELDFLLRLLEQYVIEERSEIMRQGLRFAMIGRETGLTAGVLREVRKTLEVSRENTGMCLCLAVNYGSRSELTDAVRQIAQQVAEGKLSPGEISEETISQALYTSGMLDPDLVIRTAGEMRISNFLLWQISYAELWVTEKCWPEFRRPDLIAALKDFAARDRRFGGLKNP